MFAKPSSLRPTIFCTALGAFLALASPSAAQTSSLLYRRGPSTTPQRPLKLEDSWTHIPRQAPRAQRLQVNDTVFVRVSEAATFTKDGEVQRRKNALYDLVLSDWITLNGLSLKPSSQSDGDPRISGQLNQQIRSENEIGSRESITLNIATRIADIRPNGNLVLEGHKRIRVNSEVWEVSLSGICSTEDMEAGRVISSDKIVDLILEKRDRGHVRDANKRGWFIRIFDAIDPF